MIRPELVKMLVCPDNKSQLAVASSELIERLNRAIAAGQVSNKAGQKVAHKLDGGLVRADGAVLYPIVDEIPMMLVDEAIPLDQVSG
ncbi:MAG TPA: Trm112 family protein [Pirellulales bacterium]|nr:Trm112 family protein [Pirellulales bacterium]